MDAHLQRVRLPLQPIKANALPANAAPAGKLVNPDSALKKTGYVPCSSPVRSSSVFGLATSSPGFASTRASSIASSPPPPTPRDAVKHRADTKAADVLATCECLIEHINLEASGQTINIVIGQTVHIGRKLKKLEASIQTDQATTSTRHTHTLVTIPKAAKHASRHHCSLTLQRESSGELRLSLEVLGQNGVQLHGQKIPKGTRTVDVPPEEATVLGFFTNFDINISCTPVRSVHVPETEQALPSAPTSEATLGLDLDLDDEDEEYNVLEEEEHVVRPAKRGRSESVDSILSDIASPPLALEQPHSSLVKRARLSSEARSSPAPSPYAHQEDDGYPPESSSESEDEETAESKRAAQLHQSEERVRAAIRTLSLDLVGILASGIVFQPRATLTTSECIHSLLETQPSLLQHGNEEAWRASVQSTLRSGPFGAIENEGLKDAAGKKLEPDWFYRPELDKDVERKASLQPFVKSVRSTQRQKKQYFFKRPSDLKNRKW